MKIIALIPVKNEEWCLEYCLKSLSFVDQIIAIDDNSTDSTLNILKKYNCTVISLDTKTKIGWKEYDIRKKLLESAREHEATHVIAIDADESCSNAFQKNARSIFEKLKPGQSLELEWLNLCSKKTYKKPEIFKTFVFCDDKKSVYKEGFIGIPRVPQTEIKPVRIYDNNLIFHYQFIDIERCKYKQAWYMISEFLNKNKSAYRINNMYKHTKELKCDEINDVNKQPKIIPQINSNNIWQKTKIWNKINEYGIRYFEPLDIWHIKEFEDMFIKEMGRKPKPKTFPKWLIFINDIKNIIKNKL